MEIKVRIENGTAVFVLSGRLVLGERLDLVRERVSTLVREGYREFVIDLNSVSHIDSAGLSELIAIYTNARREGAVSIRVVGPRRVSDLIAISTIITKFR